MSRLAARNRAKWIVLLVTLALLAAVLAVGPDGLNLSTVGDTDGLAQSSSDEEARDLGEESETQSAETAPPTTPTAARAIARPTIDSAGYRVENNVQVLTLGGTADEQCDLQVLLGGEMIAPLNRSGTNWTVEIDSPDVGTFEVRAECLVNGELVAFNARDLQVQAPEGAEEPTAEPAAAATDSTESGDAATEDGQAADAATSEADAVDTGDAAAANDESAVAEEGADEPSGDEDIVITGELFDLRFANDMDDWIGGYLLVRGKGTPGASVAVIFAKDDDTVESGTLVNAEGDWAVRGFITEPGEYQISARSGENTARVGNVTIPDGVVFGGPGLCGGGRVAPYGTLNGDKYVVADCEFFGLIAKRLGIGIADLRAVNPQIANLNLIQAGDEINVPPLP